MKVGRWSTTAGNNNTTPPDGWPEGQAPSTVNDCAREMMASIRTLISDAQYIDQDFTPTYINATSFSVPGNQTSAIHAGRRLKLFDAATVYGTVATASFTTVTTINISADAGSLTSSLSSFGLSILTKSNDAIPRRMDLLLSSLEVVSTAQFNASVIAATVRSDGTLTVNGAAIVYGTMRTYSTHQVNSIVVDNGTVGSPSMTFAIDTDTGFYWGGVNGYFRWASNGVFAGQFEPGGNQYLVGTLTQNSDPRLKKDWRDLPANFLERLANVQVGTYTRRDTGDRQAGVNALDMLQVLPEVVNQSEKYLSVAYGNAALAACVELAKEVLSLRERLNKLEKTT